MSDRFHRAARDGFLDVLKEATKRDCNHQDEDGLTPTACAAYEGKLEALRLLVSRGGDPDKSDNYGNTALHCASARGHMTCVTFLVNFGANIWALDNDFHSAKKLAAMNNKEDVLRFLDEEEAKQEKFETKKSKKSQEKARKDAEKQQKEFEKLMEKADKKRLKEEMRHTKDREKNNIENANPDVPKKSFFGTITKNSKGALNGTQRGSNPLDPNAQNVPRFSDLTQQSNQNNYKKTMSALQQKILRKKIKEENKNNSDFKIREGSNSVRKLSGVRGGTEIMYVRNESLSSGSSESPTLMRRGKIPEEFKREDEPVYVPGLLTRTTSVPDIENSHILQQRGSMFGFGEIGFRHPFTPTMTALQSKLSDSHSSEDDGLPPDSPLPFEEQDLPSDDEDYSSPVCLFLKVNGLEEYIPIFARERVDLDALMLLTDQDLEAMKLPLGPRRKLLKAVNDRRASLEQPGEVIDIRL